MITQTQIVFFLLAGLFGTLFIVFVYYLYNEKLVANQYESDYQFNMDKLAPETSRSTSTSTSSSSNSQSISAGDSNSSLSPSTVQSTNAPGKQVFNISENKYSYNEAKALCKVFDSELATLEQLVDAYRNGADWCNYGWVKDQMAFYPTQKATWEKLQENSTPEKRNVCGKPGLNGGYFNNPDLRFGVTCYGIKPEPRAHERVKNRLISDTDAELQRMIDNFRKETNNITILPFNREKWGGCNA
jgi:hypothetical protein